VIADHTEVGRVTPVRVAAFGRGHLLLTDRAPAKPLRDSLTRRGVRIAVARR
jgi:hypothetical protein